MDNSSGKFPLQAKLMMVIVIVSVAFILLRFVEIQKSSASYQAALPVMDKASQHERDATSQALSKYVLSDSIRGVTQDRRNLKGFLTIKDAYHQLSTADRDELLLLSYRAAFGLSESVRDFSGQLIIQTVDENEIGRVRLIDGIAK